MHTGIFKGIKFVLAVEEMQEISLRALARQVNVHLYT